MELIKETKLKESYLGAPNVTLKMWANVSFEQVKEHPGNPMIHDDALIELSMGKFGYANVSITVDEDWTILGGHGSKAALKANGYTSIPLVLQVISDWTDEEKMQFRMVLNKSTMNARFNMELTGKLISDMVSKGMSEDDLKITGFNPVELASMIEQGAQQAYDEVHKAIEISEPGAVDPSVEPLPGKVDKYAGDDWSPYKEDEIEADYPDASEISSDSGNVAPNISGGVNRMREPPQLPWMVTIHFSSEEDAKDWMERSGIEARFAGRRNIFIDMRKPPAKPDEKIEEAEE